MSTAVLFLFGGLELVPDKFTTHPAGYVLSDVFRPLQPTASLFVRFPCLFDCATIANPVALSLPPSPQQLSLRPESAKGPSRPSRQIRHGVLSIAAASNHSRLQLQELLVPASVGL